MSGDEGYGGGELWVDTQEMDELLNMVFHFFVEPCNRTSYPALMESMLDGLGYIYYCRKRWRRSSLLMSMESELSHMVRSNRAGVAVSQFNQVAEIPLSEVLNVFVRHKLRFA